VEWAKENTLGEEGEHFRAEAAELLGIDSAELDAEDASTQ